jgi:hypothetical protein
MTAHAVIEQIKALPPEERAKVVDFIHDLESTLPPRVRYADDKDFAAAAKWTFSEHVDLMRKLSQ